MAFTTNRSLIMRIRNGSHVGWEEFHRTYTAFIRKVAKDEWRFGEFALEQLVSDVICSVFNNGVLAYDPSKGGFRIWLRQIIKRRAWDLRKRQNELSALSHEEQIKAAEDACIESQASEFEAKWNDAWKRQVLKESMEEVRRKIEPKAWQAFEMLALKGHPAKEAAAALGMTESNVYVCKHRVLAELRECAKTMMDL